MKPLYNTHQKFVKGLTGLGVSESEAEALIGAGLETPKKAKAASDEQLKAAGLSTAKIKKLKPKMGSPG
jgi:hypothetical protein